MPPRKITPANANELREKGLITRRSMSEINRWIDDNLKTIAAYATGKITFEEFSKQMSPMEKAFLGGIDDPDPQKAMAACERILDRLKGKPKQAVEANVQEDIHYHLKFGE